MKMARQQLSKGIRLEVILQARVWESLTLECSCTECERAWLPEKSVCTELIVAG